MAIRIYNSSNLIVFEDTATSQRRKYPANNIWYRVEDTTPKLYTFYNVYNLGNEIFKKEYTEFEDSLGNTYSSEAEFEIAMDNLLRFQYTGNYSSDVAAGKITGKTTVNKFAYNLDVDTTEVLISSWDAVFDPATDVITTAQTFDIAYNNVTDGDGKGGALSILFTYIDENFETQDAIHVLGSTGTDTTSFSGLGINRAVCLSFGSEVSNQNDITITAKIDGTIQAQIPAFNNVTQQAILHTQINHNFLWSQFLFNSTKLSGGGQPEITFKGYSFSRVTSGVYEVFRLDFDTQRGNAVVQTFNEPFVIGGREVLFFTAVSDVADAVVNFRFSGIEERIL